MSDKERIRRLAEWMGWRVYNNWVVTKPGINTAMKIPDHWNPLERIQDAWMLVEKLHEKGWYINLSDMRGAEENPGWWYELDRYEPIYEENVDKELYGKAWCATHFYELDGGATTAPLAICKAIEKLLEVNK